MTLGVKFSETFWDNEFTGTSGLDNLMKKMKESRQSCKEFHDMLKARAKCEEDYAKSLQKISKTNFEPTDTGTMKQAWEAFIKMADVVYEEHAKAAMAFHEAARRMENFMELQKMKRKQADTNIDKVTKKKAENYAKTMSTKKTYETKYKELVAAEQQVFVAKGGGSDLTPKELEKVYIKEAKAKNAKEHADVAYKTCVDNLDKVRIEWETQMVQACDCYQQLEEEKIAFIRNEMWVQANLISSTCLEDDRACEEVRCVLEKCTIEDNINSFVSQYSTGSRRPAAIPYEECRPDHEKPHHVGASTFQTPAPKSRTMEPLPQPPRPSQDQGDPTYSSIDSYR